MSFLKVKSYKDISKTTSSFAAKRGFEVLVGAQYEENPSGYDLERVTGYQVEVWYADDDSELFLVAYTIQDDGTLYFKNKTLDIHKELSKVEDLPLTIKNDKELRSVVDHIATCLK